VCVCMYGVCAFQRRDVEETVPVQATSTDLEKRDDFDDQNKPHDDDAKLSADDNEDDF